MNREIKFRGIYTDLDGNKKWVYGDLVHGKKITQTGLENKISVGGYSVDENTVGQYTGLKDINGKEIFEGDIIKPQEKYITTCCIVVWESIGLKLKTNNWCNWFAEYVWSDCEIVGNIYDNPELLKS